MVTEHSADTKDARRIEVFTGAGRRRAWSAEEKARIVAETVTSGESVCAVARRHGLSPQQLFGWRRQAREPLATRAEPLLVPAVVETLPAEPRPKRRRRRAEKVRAVFGMARLRSPARPSSVSPRSTRSKQRSAAATPTSAAPFARRRAGRSSTTSSPGCEPSSQSSARKPSSQRRSAMLSHAGTGSAASSMTVALKSTPTSLSARSGLSRSIARTHCSRAPMAVPSIGP